MVQVRATVVSLGLTIAGDVASFGAAQQAALKASLRASTGCEEPACFLELRIQAGSIDVEGLLTIPHEASATGANTAPATANSTVAAVQAAATTLLSSPPATISSALSVTVTSADPIIRTQANVVVPLAMGPPPPMPPLPPPIHPPILPQSSHLAVNALNGSYSYSYGSYSYGSYSYGQHNTPDANGPQAGNAIAPPAPPLQGSSTGDTHIAGQVTQSVSGGGGDGSTMGMTMAIVGAGIGSLLLFLSAARYYVRRRAQRKSSSAIITKNTVAVDLASVSAIADVTEAAVGGTAVASRSQVALSGLQTERAAVGAARTSFYV